jgi:Tfp pilus assembly protein PilO
MKDKLPKSVYFLVTYVLLIAVVILFGILPGISRLREDRSTLKDNSAKIAADESKISDLSKYNKNDNDLKTIESSVNNLLPDNKNSSDFVVQMEALGNELSIVIPTLTITEPVAQTAPAQSTDVGDTPAKPSSNTKSTDTAFNMSFRAPYTTFKTFLEKIEAFPRFTTISSVSVSGYSADNGTLEYDLKGNIYYGK